MGITLKEIYEQTKEQFKLQLIAGEAAMNNEVSRLYYVEDMISSDWIRPGELLTTTAMQVVREEGWLLRFIDSVLPYQPSGIMINMGGYLEEVPKEVIAYCDNKQIPLLTFPWETALQDVMQDFTNRIFEIKQWERSISKAFYHAIFTPEDQSEYCKCLEKNGYSQQDHFLVAAAELPNNEQKKKYFVRMIQELGNKTVFVEHKQKWLLVFENQNTDAVIKVLKNAVEAWKKEFQDEDFWLGIGTEVEGYQQLGDSYEKAEICQKYGRKNGQKIVSFEDMGVIGLLAASDKTLLKNYMDARLGFLEEYDRKNQTDYMKTLEAFLFHGGNAMDVAKEMYVHRNTVNYRIKKIKELLGEDFSSMDTIVEYRIACYIRKIL